MFSQFKNKFPLTDEKWLEYTNYFNRIEVPSKTILLEEGEISKKLFIIEKGCIRVWFNNNGKDLTTQFFFENQSVASIESFMKKISSPVVVETIEPSIIWWIHKKDLDKILEEIKEIPELRDRLINMLFQRTFDYMKYFVSFIKDSPTQRYINLIEERPQIVQRVPQHYIASYLGVSTVHLSRIKSKLVQEK
ncbi:cyclic nucleotide-binding protein [Flavobacteriaceae bacterium CRH]|nr:cyclic nucleotide-binding protein [Flavobacteriaceae bacterium CRH]